MKNQTGEAFGGRRSARAHGLGGRRSVRSHGLNGRFIAGLLAFCMLLSMLTITANAADESFVWDQGKAVDQALTLPAGLIPDDGETYEWGLSGGSDPLPVGITISPASGTSGTAFKITGTPANAGEGTIYVGFAVSGGTYGPGASNYVYSFNYLINPHICWVEFMYDDWPTVALPDGEVNSHYQVQILAESCGSPIVFSDGGGVDGLPGLSISPSGVLSGTPTAAGVFTFMLNAEVSGREHNASDECGFRLEIKERTVNEAPKYEVEILKTDMQGKPLEGANITLTEVFLDGAKVGEDKGDVYSKTTNKDGAATFSIPEGYYEAVESKAPAGYKKDAGEYLLYVSANGIYLIIIPDDGDEIETEPVRNPAITFINEQEAPQPSTSAPSEKTMKVLKTDEKGAPLAGAVIRAERAGAGDRPPIADVRTDKDGAATFTLTNGTYILSEFAAPEGYNATDEAYEIQVASSLISYRAYHTGAGASADGGSGTSAGGVGAFAPYETITFVNKLIPTLNKDDHFAYMLGYPDGTFGPDRNMTRAEAVVMFSRLLSESMGLDVDYREDFFSDVDNNEWYANQVGYMRQLGVLADYYDYTGFRPDEPVTRAEFATLAAHFDNLALTRANRFTDVPDKHWAVKYINSAAEKGWIIGYPDNTFKPEDYITRAEIVTLVNRILERVADEAYIAANKQSLPREYSDTAGHWAYLTIMEASLGHDYDIVEDAAAGADSHSEKWTAVYE